MDDHNLESSLDGLSLVIVEDEPLFRILLEESVVSRFPTTTVLGSYATAEECLKQLDNKTFDVLLTDIDLGKGMNGPALGVHLRLAEQVRGVVLLSNLALPSVLSTLPPSIQGGWSYLLKPSVNNFDQLSRAITSASQGGVLLDESLVERLVSRKGSPLEWLKPRQLDVLSRMARGWSNRRIAEDLGLTVRTAETVVYDIMATLQIREGEDGLNPRPWIPTFR
jgi:DNA-binding NarL/FixJ family response regulator